MRLNQAKTKIIRGNHGVIKIFDISQSESRIPSQVRFVVKTNQKKYSHILKYFLDQNQTMYMKLLNQSILLNFSKMITYTIDTEVRFVWFILTF